MGRLTARLAAACAVAVLLLTAAAPGSPVLGFTGFGASSADATYGQSMTFRVGLAGGAPDRLELLLRFTGSDATLVVPVQAGGDAAEYVWDAADRYVTPNTRISYRWRATTGHTVRLSPEGTLLYDDDRPGLDWQSAVIGRATVHWYGGAEGVARRFGDLTADGAARAEALLGHEMAGPVDIFVYEARDDFFGALGPGAREWFGAATFPELRTIFMWLGGGSSDYLETTIVHEVTHVVFSDATDNPLHSPAKWLNEGLATWAETQSADLQRAVVQAEADDRGLFSFEAISYDFPFGTRGATLSYAMGTTMVDMLIGEHGPEAIARLAEAYRNGASDAEALEAAAGEPADALYAAYYDAFGADEPQPVEAAPILPSNVRKPGDGPSGPDGPGATPAPAPGPGAENDGMPAWIFVAIVVVVAVAAGGGWLLMRRSQEPPA
ncbi:MAG TPA: peptidase MA family metallohydrolase [Candidatus Limnocylindria bacterium]|nr:peptidase MA family metallohydrolase [Candidatus Limnocylindria bacterium]